MRIVIGGNIQCEEMYEEDIELLKRYSVRVTNDIIEPQTIDLSEDAMEAVLDIIEESHWQISLQRYDTGRYSIEVK